MAKSKQSTELNELSPTLDGMEAMEAKAMDFFESNPNYHEDYVYVSSDLVVFHGNVKGKNYLDNHMIANSDKSMSAKKFNRN